MSQAKSPGEEGAYIVQSQAPDLLAQVVAIVKGDPEIRLVREIGPPGKPHTLAIVMREDQAVALRERFKGQVIVERDRPLSTY